MTIKEQQKQAGARLRELAALANTEGRAWSTEDEQEWTRCEKDYVALKAAAEAEAPQRFGRPDASAAPAPPTPDDLFSEFYRDTRSGSLVPVVTRSQSFASAVSRGRDPRDIQEQYGTLSLGSMLRALAIGCESDTERRALAEGTDSAGGYSVPSILSAQAIDLLRKKSRVFQAGAIAIPLDSDQHSFAKLLADPSPAWRVENAAVAESDPNFGQVLFQPRSLAVVVKVSEELLQDSVNINQVLTMSLASALALEVDRVSLLGSGISPEPKGVNNFSAINTVSMGTNGAAVADYSDLLDAIQKLQEDNAGDVSAAIMAPRTLRAFNGLTDSTGQPLQRPQSLAGLPFLETTQIPVDQTQGTSNDASTILLGDFSKLVIGFRQRLRIEILKEVFRSNLQIGFVAHLRADVAAWHEESFAKIVGIVP